MQIKARKSLNFYRNIPLNKEKKARFRNLQLNQLRSRLLKFRNKVKLNLNLNEEVGVYLNEAD